MKKPSPKKRTASAGPAPASPGKPMYWAVALTCVAALVLLMRLARDILAQLQAQAPAGGAGSTRLLTGLFVVMCLAGFVAAGLWKVGGKLRGGEKK